MKIPQALLKTGVAIQTNTVLAPYTYMKVGGPAQYFAVAKSVDDLVNLTQAAGHLNLPLLVLGGGSNLIISDLGIQGLVIINRSDQITLDQSNPLIIQVDSGVIINRLVNHTVNQGWGNLEEFLGVPGTVGGAVYNNSHHLNHLIGDYIQEVMTIDPKGKVHHYSQLECHFAYDTSIFQTKKETILSTKFILKSQPPELLRKKAQAALKRRRNTQPLSLPSSGCMFKNPTQEEVNRLALPQKIAAAGYLIDQAGLKGYSVGGAAVSAKHANFIINVNHATAADIKKLSDFVIHTIKEKYGITLEREVFFVGE